MRNFLASIFCLVSLSLSAQNIEAVRANLSFPDTDEKNMSTAELKIFNSGIYVLQISDIDLFSRYGHQPFGVSDTAFQLQPLDTHTVVVSFFPEQNIQHKMELVVKTSSGFGHLNISLLGQGDFSIPYYSSTKNKSGAALRSELANLVDQNYNSLGYTNARDNMYASIDNTNGQVEGVYTGRTATFNTRSGANSNNFNCEHTFPQGKFNKNEPMRSDIHHLFPTDVQANSERGNDPFGVVTNASWSVGGSKSGNGNFEPRDVQKGASARGMMYFVLRYQDYGNFYQGQENILLQWHNQYPPSADERARNLAIENLQNNRNPFVDYPQFMDRMNSLTGSADLPQAKELYLSDDTIKLAKAAGRYDYTFVAYNPGNAQVTLSNFNLSDTSLRFTNGNPGSITLAPQTAQRVLISFNSGEIYAAETLTMDSDVPGKANISIPIKSGEKTPVSVGEYEDPNWLIYPNPADEYLMFENIPEGSELEVYDLNGRLLIDQLVEERLEIEQLPEGQYILNIESPAGLMQQRKITIK